MTIGNKISKLRSSRGLSQEQLAEALSVSRQSVSKWEMDQALPQIDKALAICKLFGITADELLRENVNIVTPEKGERKAGKYFGTDGFRGEANTALTTLHAYKVGRFLGWYYSCRAGQQNPSDRPKIVIGKDTRRSSYTFEYGIAAGITASGADAYMLHVTTTPSVSYVTRQDGFDCAVMITASHNPFYDNGIKILNRHGEKLDDKTTALVEAYLDNDLMALGIDGSDLPLATKDKIGCIVDYVSGRNRYLGYLISLASHSYKNLRIGLDCANGASWMIADAVFSALGAQTFVVGAEPNGLNINNACGSTHIENLQALVKEKRLDIGFAFDGDADRCIAVDENGKIVDGDGILYVLAKRLKERGMLEKNTVVATVMSNSGLQIALEKIGVNSIQTTVGDRFVYEKMQENDFSLGGEQSGHVILKKYATTGDGILTAIMIAEQICDTKMPLSKLTEPLKLYPQRLKSIYVKSKDDAINDPQVQKALDEVRNEINGRGRALLRKSGTEPVIRIMIECESDEKATSYIEIIENAIKDGGHVCKN